MDNIRQAIDRLGGLTPFVAAIGVRYNVATNWFYRRAIPAEYAPSIERYLHSHGITAAVVAPAAAWVRVPDPLWPPGLGGRPLLDCAAMYQASAPAGIQPPQAARPPLKKRAAKKVAKRTAKKMLRKPSARAVGVHK